MSLTLGPPRHFVPICIRHAHGFHGGPAGYQEIRDKAEAKAIGVIVLDARQRKETERCPG